MRKRAYTSLWPILLAVLWQMLPVMPAQADEALQASKTEFAVGEIVTLQIPGALGLVKPKWTANPNGIVEFDDKGRTEAEVKAIKPGQVTVSAKVKSLFGSDTYSIRLTVKPAEPIQAKPGQGTQGGANAGKGPSVTDARMSQIGDLLKRYEAELGDIRTLFDKGANEGGTPVMDAASQQRLGQITGKFFKELAGMGLTVRDLQGFKAQFMAAGPGGSPLFPGQGAWDDAFLGTERALMMGRAQVVQRLWMETLQDTFRANPDAAVFGEIDIGSWVKMRLGDLGFQADIDFSSVSIDPALNRWIVDQFEGKLRAHSGLDMVQADALLTAHGQASPDVFIGHWGKSFAELDMLKRSKWKVIKVEKNADGSLVLDGNGQPKITMVERPGSQLFWEVAFRKLEAGRFAEVDYPKMDLAKEPMLSLEMLRHGIHDIEHGPYSRGQKLIKMLKYAERSYFMNKKAVAGAGGFNPYAANDGPLADAATKIIANKNDPAKVADLLQALAGEEITEANVDAVTDRLVARAKTAMHDNATRSLAFRLNDIARIDAEDARQSALDKLWHDLETEVRTFQDTAGRPPEVMVRALELTKAVMEGKLPPSELEARSRELHALLNDAYKLPDSVIGRIMMSDTYLKVKAALRKLGWVEKSINDFVDKAKQKYPNGAAFHEKFQELNNQLNKTTAGSGLLKAADFADNAFSVYEAYLGADADQALWNASLALGRAGLQEAFPSLQIPLALYDSVRTGSPKPLGMAVVFMYFPFAGQTYMVSQMMQRADVAIRDAEFYAGLNKVLDVTDFDTQGRITGFSLKNILGKEIDSASISPPGNRKAIVALFSDPGGSFYTSQNFRYWASLVPSKNDQFGLYENKLEKLRRFFNHSEDVRYMTLMLENFRSQGAKLPQDQYTAQREAALARMEGQLAETLWVAMADMLESAAQSVQSNAMDAQVKKVEDDLNLGDSGLGKDKGLLSKIKWEIRQNSSLFSGENPYAVGLIYDKYLKAYERVAALRRQITLDTWYTDFGLDVSAAQTRPMKILLTGGKLGAPSLTGDPAKDVELAERTVAIHKQRAEKIRADLAGALGRDIDPARDKEHLKALGQLGMEWEHLLDDCAERAAGNCETAVRTALKERLDGYKAYLAQLNAGTQPIPLAITGPDEVKPGDRAEFSVRFEKSEDRNRPGLALRWSVDGKSAGNGEKLSLKPEKAGSLNIGLTAWVGENKEAKKLSEASRTLAVKDGEEDKTESNDSGIAAEIDAALRARDWKALADRLEATRKDQNLRLKHTERYDARMKALGDALRLLKDERMKWLLAWEGYIRELERVDNRAYDSLKKEVEAQTTQFQNQCFEKGSDPAHLRGDRCRKEAYAYEEKCLPKAQRDAHWAEQKAIRSARNLLPNEVHLMHSTGFSSYPQFFGKVEALAKEHRLPFPYPEPVVTRLKYVSQCAKLEDTKSTKKQDDLTGLKVSLRGPTAPVPLGKPVSVTTSASGGKGPYSYAWSGASGSGTRGTLTPAWAGDWTVSVTVRDSDGNGGEASITVMVSPMKIRLAGAKGQVFYGSEAKLSTEGLGLPLPAPTADPCAGHTPNSNPFDPCNKVEIDPCNPMGPFCVDTTRSGTIDYTGGKGRSTDDYQGPSIRDPAQEFTRPPVDAEAKQAKPQAQSTYRVIWQSDRNLTFNPPTSDDGTTKVTYDRMGEVKLWCELLKWEGGDYQTVGECEQETITVVAPKFSVTFTPSDGQARVGQEVRARINAQPSVPAKLIDYRWLEPATSNRMEYTENSAEIGFQVKDANTLVLKALARVPHWGDEIGSVDATYTGAIYEVKAWVVEPGTRPRMWDPKKGGLIPVPKGSYATFERIGLKAEVQGGPTEGVRWQWTVNEGTSISNPWSQTPTVSRGEPGGISAKVVARDINGSELGSAEVGLSVIEVSDQPPKPTPADDKAEARRLSQQAEQQLKQGDIPAAADSIKQAMARNASVAASTARRVADAAKQAGWRGVYERDFSQAIPHLETAVELNPQDRDAKEKLDKARRFSQVWPRVEEKAREFDAQMAEKKVWTAQKTMLQMQDLQHEMTGGMSNHLSKRVMDAFNAGVAEYNVFMREVEATHTRTFKVQDWQAMLDNAEAALRRDHPPANEKMLKGNVDFARQMLREQEAKVSQGASQGVAGSVAGTWAINGNGYKGKLEINDQGGRLSGRVWYDAHSRWEALDDVRFDGRTLTFTRPIPGATQRYTGTFSGNEVKGNFTQQGTSRVYTWSAQMQAPAVPGNAPATPSGVSLRLDKTYFKPGETITVHFTALASWASNAWIGIIPSRIPHGEESENDRHDVTYQYLKKRTSGTLAFTAPAAGDWDMRMHDKDSNGKEVASVSFKVAANAGSVQPGPVAEATGGAHEASFQGSRYRAVLVPGGISWADADRAARSLGGYLASIASDAENDAVYALVKDDDRFWFQDSYRNGIGPWLGGLQPAGASEPRGGWRWASGEPFSFSNWAGGEPNNASGNENRLQFFAPGTLKGAQWNDIGEQAPVRGYIVEFPGVANGNVPADTQSGTGASAACMWKTNIAELTLNQSGNQVSGAYSSDGGEIVGEMRGNVLEGFWIENSSNTRCATARNGRYHWGRIRWVFDGNRFAGSWSYCDSPVPKSGNAWTGERMGSTPAAPAASPAPAAAPQPNNAPANLEDSVKDLEKSLKDLKGLFNW